MFASEFLQSLSVEGWLMPALLPIMGCVAEMLSGIQMNNHMTSYTT